MSELEALIARTTIEFRRPLRSVEVEHGLFPFLQYSLGCTISYTISESKVVGDRFEDPRQNRAVRARINGIEIKGRVLTREAGVSFECYTTDFTKATRFHGIKFDTIPGYSIEENPPRDVELMDRVREQVGKYFSRCYD